jgi:hypothetical protein
MFFDPFPEPYEIADQAQRLRLSGTFWARGKQQPVWVELSHQRFEPSDIQCLFRYPRSLPDPVLPQLDEDLDLDVSINSPFDGMLHLRGIGPATYGSTEASLKVAGYDLLPRDWQIHTGSAVHAVLELTSPGLQRRSAGRIMNLDGTITRRFPEPVRIEWNDGLTNAAFGIRHHAEHTRSGRDPALLLRERPRLTIRFEVAAKSDLSSVLDKVEAFADVPLLLFSFLSRREVGWFELFVFVSGDQGPVRQLEARRRTSFWPAEPYETRERPVIEEEVLASGLFSELLVTLQSVPWSSDGVRSLRYYLGSHSQSDLETRFILAFAAFETLVNVLDSQHPSQQVSARKLSKLLTALRSSIREQVTVLDLPSECVPSILAKLPELKRPPLADRLRFHLSRLEVNTTGLWIERDTLKERFDAGLQRIITSRNALVHNTSLEDPAQLRADLVRLQNLFDRIFLAALGRGTSQDSRVLKEVNRFNES